MANRLFDWGKTDLKFNEKKNGKKIQSGGKHDKGDIPTKFCRDLMADSHFIVGTSWILSRFGSLVTLTQEVTEMGAKSFPTPIG